MPSSLSVSVVIPCYNGAQFLSDTLDSVLAQTVLPQEVIVVDDGSTDNTSEVATSYGHPVRVIKQENQGESVARNRGIDAAKGDWIAFLDADDIWQPSKLQKQIAAVSSDCIGVHTNVYFFGAQSGETRIQDVPPEVRYDIKSLALRNHFVTPSALMVRRNLSLRFPVWTTYGEDLLYNMSLVQLGAVELVQEPLTGYRKHVGSQSANAKARIGWFEAMDEWLRRNAGAVSEQMSDEIREGYLRQVVDWAWRAKWNRQWSDFADLRSYLEQFEQVQCVRDFLRVPIYPRWVYFIADKVRRA